MRRHLAGLTAAVLIAFATTGCTSNEPFTEIPTPQPHMVQGKGPMSAEDIDYLNHLRFSQPKIYTGCPGQGSEMSITDIKPNVRVIGQVINMPTAEDPVRPIPVDYFGGTGMAAKEIGTQIFATWNATGDTTPFGYVKRTWKKGEFNVNGPIWGLTRQTLTSGWLTVNTVEYSDLVALGFDLVYKCDDHDDPMYKSIGWATLFANRELG